VIWVAASEFLCETLWERNVLLLRLSIVVLVVLERCCRPLHEESTHCPD
jgi:hypothetical protein